MSEKSEVYLKIKTEYEVMIKITLNEKRLLLRDNYENFIRTLENQAHEMMLLYEEVVKAKFDAGHDTALELERLERGRRQSERIQALESSIREVELKVQQLNRMLAALNQKYKPQMSEVEQELRK